MTDVRVFSGHQPNFLPYMGVFYKMYRSDVFVLDDDVQYSRDGLHNANFIKVNGSKHRITVPVKYNFGDPINRVEVCNGMDWSGKMLKTMKCSYAKAPHFEEGYELMERHFQNMPTLLSDLNIGLIREIADRFGMKCKIVIASESVPTDLKKNERNLHQCIALGGTEYLSGEGGRAYNDEELFVGHGINVKYSDYHPLHYRQVGREFIENLSVIDYIFNAGFAIPEEWQNNSR